MAAHEETADAGRLAALWDWLSSWIVSGGGVNGPVVHRGDLKRMLAIHDTPWTQEATIEGLLQLYRRSGRDYWLNFALRLGDAQCARQRADCAFRWAGHEDDRFSSLIHNALADCALLHLADVLRDRSDAARRTRYVTAAQRNLEQYVIGALYRPRLQGFAMNPTDYYAGRDRFVVNMNSVAIEALIKLDRQRGSDRHTPLVRAVGERIRSLQSRQGPGEGGLPYSDLEPETHVPLYTALALRGLIGLADVTRDPSWAEVTRGVVAFLNRLEDSGTGLWYHKLEGPRLHRFPLFVAGAGMICNGLVDAVQLTGAEFDVHALARRLLRFQYHHGAIRNFIGYDHPDNGRPRGRAKDCWEDVYPTPNWNAQAFRFLCRVLPPPEPPVRCSWGLESAWSRRYVYMETRRLSVVAAMWPLRSVVIAVFLKRLRHGLVVPGPHMIVRAVVNRLTKFSWGRAALQRIRPRK
jgi:hypothetical protein